MEKTGWAVVIGCLFTVTATLIAKAFPKPRQSRIIVFGPSDSPYTAGFKSMLAHLSPHDRDRLIDADEMFETFFDNAVSCKRKRRLVQDLLDDLMCLRGNLHFLEAKLIRAIKEAAGSELNLKRGLVATTEILVLLHKVEDMELDTRRAAWSM